MFPSPGKMILRVRTPTGYIGWKREERERERRAAVVSSDLLSSFFFFCCCDMYLAGPGARFERSSELLHTALLLFKHFFFYSCLTKLCSSVLVVNYTS